MTHQHIYKVILGYTGYTKFSFQIGEAVNENLIERKQIFSFFLKLTMFYNKIPIIFLIIIIFTNNHICAEAALKISNRKEKKVYNILDFTICLIYIVKITMRNQHAYNDSLVFIFL